MAVAALASNVTTASSADTSPTYIAHDSHNMESSPLTSAKTSVSVNTTSDVVSAAEYSHSSAATFNSARSAATLVNDHSNSAAASAAPSTTNHSTTASESEDSSTTPASSNEVTIATDIHWQSTFQRVLLPMGDPRYSPININIIGLCLSPCLAELRRRKYHNEDWNHVGFLTTIQALEEDVVLQETFTFKEAMKSSYKPQVVAAMEQEINNHTSRKHWPYCEMSAVPHDQILRSTWTFRIKRNRSTNKIINFKARFYADSKRQEFGVNYNKTHAQVVKCVTI